MGHREELIQRSIPFLQEVKDMTPSAQMEKWLNEKYSENSDLYKDLARLALGRVGVDDGPRPLRTSTSCRNRCARASASVPCRGAAYQRQTACRGLAVP